MADPSARRYDLLDTLMEANVESPPPSNLRPPRKPSSSPSRSPRRSQTPSHDDTRTSDTYRRQPAKRLRFKSPSRSHSRRAAHPTDEPETTLHSTKHNSHSHRKHRRRRREGRSEGRSERENTEDPALKDPDAAFRASLFDAMVDDEAADFWSTVYGEDIPTSIPSQVGPDGLLERMSDEEYTAYMRQRMWEKTHQFLLEEREAREERRRKAEERHRQNQKEAQDFNARMDESLRRGRERKDGRAWEDYGAAWAKFLSDEDRSKEQGPPWPVRGGRVEDVSRSTVKDFFEAGVRADKERRNLRKILKSERVRWHPDKVQQRMGEKRMAKNVEEKVTAVFQVIDELFAAT